MNFVYNSLIKPLLFKFDPETVHDHLFATLKVFNNSFFQGVIRAIADVSDPRLAVEVGGVKFKNPIGLAAGFDKNAVAFELLDALSFGHVEVGTITKVPQEGNPRPRIIRLPADNALINRMGFPSIGLDAVLPRLKEISKQDRTSVLGVNIGKSKITPIDDAAQDYLYTFKHVEPYSDYVTVNVSSPNTPDLRKLQEPARLLELFKTLRAHSATKPIFVKVAPDLTLDELDEIVGVCMDGGISALIATNTALFRTGLKVPTQEVGGLSGKPILSNSLMMVRHLYRTTQGKLPIIGVGGISSVSDVINMYKAGASLVQVYTALIYEGPLMVSSILSDLISFIEREKIKSLLDIRGTE